MHDPAELIRRFCRRADRRAFHIFYESQAPRLWRFLIARGCEPDAAYDLLAEAFLRFVHAVCKDPRAPVAFLYRIAINLHIDQHRRRKAAPVERNPEALAQAAAPRTDPDRDEDVRRLLGTLPPDEQNLLLLRYWIGLTHRETAAALDLPEGTVRRRAAEILKRLAQRWEDEEA